MRGVKSERKNNNYVLRVIINITIDNDTIINNILLLLFVRPASSELSSCRRCAQPTITIAVIFLWGGNYSRRSCICHRTVLATTRIEIAVNVH